MAEEPHADASLPRNHIAAADEPRDPEAISGSHWLLITLLIVSFLAALYFFGAVYTLYGRSQWDLSFNPSHAAPPAATALPHEEIRFDPGQDGAPQLDGWWIPAAASGPYASDAILFLRDGSGSLGDSVPQLEALQALGVNILAFDYRGFGLSAELHPSEKSVGEDADAAWRYLTVIRRFPPQAIVLYGVKLGAAVAAEAAARHPDCAAVIMESPQPPLLTRLQQNPRTRFFPAWVFHDRFNPAPALAHMSTPKLFLAAAPSIPGAPRQPVLFYGGAAGPKHEAIFNLPYGESAYQANDYAESIRHFLDEYLRGRSARARSILQ